MLRRHRHTEHIAYMVSARDLGNPPGDVPEITRAIARCRQQLAYGEVFQPTDVPSGRVWSDDGVVVWWSVNQVHSGW